MSPAFRYVLVGSALLKIILAVVFADLPPRYDETEYVEFARAIREDGEPPRLWRAPLYQWFVAYASALTGGGLLGVRLLQAVLSVVASALVYRIGRRVAGERAAFWAGTAVAFYPSHVAFSHYLWSETLYGFLTVLALERLLAADEGGGRGRLLLAGVALGFATLTRSTGLVLLVTSAAWLALGRGRTGVLRAAVVCAAAAVVVLPWTMQASVRAGRLVVTDVNDSFNLWSGNNEYIPADLQGVWALGLPLENGLDARFLAYYPDDAFRRDVPVRMAEAGVTDAQGPDGAAWYRDQARRELRRDPLGFLHRLPKKLAAFWAPDFFLPRHLLRDWYGPTPPALAAGLTVLTWAASAVALIAGPAALVALSRSRFRSLALSWIGVYLSVHGMAYGHSRMHQPLVPVLLLAVAAFLFGTGDSSRVRRLVRRGAPVAALAVVAWISVWPILGGLYVHPGPRHAGMARLLAAGRELPLPGTQRQAWMLATVEASRGRNEEASRMLAESRHADLAWTWLLRALMAHTPEESRAFVGKALERDPALEAAESLSRRLDRLGVPGTTEAWSEVPADRLESKE
ncbi:MAG: ArnT family glycosyltransferase [Candidatus Eiseniibacteriota bacterium]